MDTFVNKGDEPGWDPRAQALMLRRDRTCPALSEVLQAWLGVCCVVDHLLRVYQ